MMTVFLYVLIGSWLAWWILFECGRTGWSWRRDTWYVDSLTGKDRGFLRGSRRRPLRTHAELMRRLGPVIDRNVKVILVSADPDMDPVTFDKELKPGTSIVYTGQAESRIVRQGDR